MNSDLISICVPTYNQTFFLKNTLESITNQVGVNFEVIISDDSTTEDVKLLVAEFQQTYPDLTINYFRNNPSLGSPANWNYALQFAQGEYIKIMHHDEWFIASNALLTFLEKCKKGNTLVVCSSKLIYKSIESDVIADYLFIDKVRKDPFNLIVANKFGSPSSVMFHRSNLQFFDNNLVWLVDVEYYIRLLLKGIDLFYIYTPLYCSVMDDHNITNQCLYNTELQLKEYSYLFRKFVQNRKFKDKIKYLNIIFKILLHTQPKMKWMLYLRLVKRTFFDMNKLNNNDSK
jgi:glycosyltransferase involved in cell wall biosynthesis